MNNTILKLSTSFLSATVVAAFTLQSGALLAADAGSIGEPGRNSANKIKITLI